MLHRLLNHRSISWKTKRHVVNIQMGLYRTNYLLETWQVDESEENTVQKSSSSVNYLHGKMPYPAFYIMEPVQHACDGFSENISD